MPPAAAIAPNQIQSSTGTIVRTEPSNTVDRLMTVALRNARIAAALSRLRMPLPIETIKTANLEYDVRADLKRAKDRKRQHA